MEAWITDSTVKMTEDSRAYSKLLCYEALRWTGVKEVPENKGQLVEYWQKMTGTDPGMPWCADFVYSCVRVAGQQFVHSQLDDSIPVFSLTVAKTGSVRSIWNIAKTRYAKAGAFCKKPFMGAIAVWSRDHNPNYGHIGIVISANERSGKFTSVEGNIKLHGQVEGVGERHHKVDSPRLLGFLAPFIQPDDDRILRAVA